MRLIRWILAGIIGIIDVLFAPKIMQREMLEQKEIDGRTAHLSLYQFANCPFCVKVRWAIRRLGLNIELRDAKGSPEHRRKLLEGGGKIKVPCLAIERDGDTSWLYESDAIIAYLESLVRRH